jgi:hypothetical protein
MPPSGLIDEKIMLLERELRAQAGLYNSLTELARRQAEEISAENVDAIVAFLEEKKKIVEQIEGIEAAAAPLKEFWEEHREEVGERARAGLKEAVDEIRGLLEELLEIESRSQKELGRTKDALQGQIQDLSTGAKAIGSYAPKPDHRPRFMDESG